MQLQHMEKFQLLMLRKHYGLRKRKKKKKKKETDQFQANTYKIEYNNIVLT